MNHHHQLRELSEFTSAQVETQWGCMQMKQGVLINTISTPPHTQLSEALTIALFQEHDIWINIWLSWNRARAGLTRKIHHDFLVNANVLCLETTKAFSLIANRAMENLMSASQQPKDTASDFLTCHFVTVNSKYCHLAVNRMWINYLVIAWSEWLKENG